ncbi:MAG: 50S ribosomal protein L3 [Pseudomonadota bacterium]|nr:50S ribosomal protein L3 [Pseudomonadota bacterium]
MNIYGKKVGMSRWINHSNGEVVAATVLQCDPNVITSKRSTDTNGYIAIQVGFGKAKRLNKPKLGTFKAAGVQPRKYLREIRLDSIDDSHEVGSDISVKMFETGQYVDVSGVTVGKGFAGCVKRHNFKTQDATHGNSLAHRAPGSIGQCQDPGRVFKGKKMAGRMGGVNRTTRNLEVLHVDEAKNLILVKGAVPGHKNGLVKIKAAKKIKRVEG